MTSSSFIRFARAFRVALFGAPHRHHWETIRAVPVYDVGAKAPCAMDYELRCKGCGEIQRRRV